MQKIEFYCKNCKKSMKMAYRLSGDLQAPVMTGMMIRCHTNKCTRVVMLKKFTEEQIIAKADAHGKCYLQFSSDAGNCITKTIKLWLHDMGTDCNTE